jgi:Protein of unknown function (DUF5818)
MARTTMARTILLTVTLLASAAWVQAQSQYPQSSSSQSGTSGNSGQTTVQGCLQGSSGNYTLTSDSGTTYQLQGDTSKLDKHVGHEVAITGSTSSSSASTPSTGTTPSSTSVGASGSSQTLNVDNVKHISETCSKTSK